MIKSGIAYLRTSTSSQVLGIRVQRDIVTKLAEENKIRILSFIEDIGVSGKLPLLKRGRLREALLSLAPGSYLIISDRDRLARGQLLMKEIERFLHDRNIILLHPISGDARVADWLSEKELNLIKERTRATLKFKKSCGERVGTIPFGYKLGIDGVGLAKEPKEQDIIKQIRLLRSSGLSLRNIVSESYKRGFTSRSGKALGLTQIVRICNPSTGSMV